MTWVRRGRQARREVRWVLVGTDRQTDRQKAQVYYLPGHTPGCTIVVLITWRRTVTEAGSQHKFLI